MVGARSPHRRQIGSERSFGAAYGPCAGFEHEGTVGVSDLLFAGGADGGTVGVVEREVVGARGADALRDGAPPVVEVAIGRAGGQRGLLDGT